MDEKRMSLGLVDLDAAGMTETNGGVAGDPLLWVLSLIRPGKEPEPEPTSLQ
jgi:hypothetical protein